RSRSKNSIISNTRRADLIAASAIGTSLRALYIYGNTFHSYTCASRAVLLRQHEIDGESMTSEPMASLPGDDVAVSLQEHIGIVEIRRPPDNFLRRDAARCRCRGIRPARRGTGLPRAGSLLALTDVT